MRCGIGPVVFVDIWDMIRPYDTADHADHAKQADKSRLVTALSLAVTLRSASSGMLGFYAQDMVMLQWFVLVWGADLKIYPCATRQELIADGGGCVQCRRPALAYPGTK